ncbi:hypothetical protein FRC12_002788 [Ceratobasidium sp. 428]|nr:hypothetical protein FRC12_002788 [Ceratobasidium sp. 428]
MEKHGVRPTSISCVKTAAVIGLILPLVELISRWMDVIGFIKGDGANQMFEPTLVCTGVNADSRITAQFTPVLQAYVTRDYQVSELLRGEFETDKVWEQNVSELDDVTGWNFVEDDESGQFSITPVSRP